MGESAEQRSRAAMQNGCEDRAGLRPYTLRRRSGCGLDLATYQSSPLRGPHKAIEVRQGSSAPRQSALQEFTHRITQQAMAGCECATVRCSQAANKKRRQVGPAAFKSDRKWFAMRRRRAWQCVRGWRRRCGPAPSASSASPSQIPARWG
jgi:hypothetical protein